ncbi:hypothetical protein Ciccas_005833 [Cichlidogyrus casuarinus]|uniref:Aminopeptidase n=1 Tax=Cichlidogyrus casuarinus TaxID=1844966 RepID=A0ABD2QB72_9PLAT
MSSSKFQKLPYSLKPINYNVEFVPNPHTFKYNGSQTIECEIVERVDEIKLNVADLEVWDVTCNNQSAQVSIDAANEIATFKFASPLEVGETNLAMKFRGTHNDLMKGFYKSAYFTPSGEKRWNLTTQFEASDARRAFPCIDEPDRKARFTISMIVPNNKVVLSNMPEIERKPVPKPDGFPDESGLEYVRVAFDKTPVMSTYLLAMVVGEFEHIEDKDSNGVLIRVFAPPGKKHCCDYALHIAKNSLPFYSQCFGVDYPLPKLDLIAIPDFAAGAMENWGLVTYRETALLIDPEQSSVALKRRVALVVAHELAHMWFGNLVTMKWWTHLWLNEGFATWMEYHCVEHVAPEFDIWTTFTTSELSTALSLDGLRSSHPIEVEVGPPSEVDEIFDSISYAKGASIINMLYNWIGHDSFFRGLKAYIAKHKYSNTQTEDLWDALSAASGHNICQVMSEWTKKMGYPVVKVASDPQTSSLMLSQKRFLADGSQDSENYTWPIPLSIAHSGNAKVTHLINPSEASSSVVTMPSLNGVLLNPGRSSFVRLHYSPELLVGIQKMIQEGQLGPRDRLSVIDDHISLAFAGHLPISDLIDLLKSYAGEGHHIVWDSLSSCISHIRLLIEEAGMDHGLDSNTVDRALIGLNKLYQTLAEPVFHKLGWDPLPNEDNNDTLLRSQIITILGKTGYQPVVAEASKRFNAHACCVDSGDNKGQLNPDIRLAVYATCMRHGGDDIFGRILKLYESTSMADERVRLLNTIGLTTSASLRQRAITYNMTEAVRKQDRYAALLSLYSSSPEGRRDLWKFVQENIGSLPDALGSQALLAHVCKASCRGFGHSSKESEVQAFWQANPVKCQMAVKQAMEEISINMSQLARDGEALVAKLATH